MCRTAMIWVFAWPRLEFQGVSFLSVMGEDSDKL